MRYMVKALGQTDTVIHFSLEAANKHDAVCQAQSRGYAILAVRTSSMLAGLDLRRGPRFPLVLFCQELLALLDAGLPLVEALETLVEKEHHAETRTILEGVIGSLYEGKTLSQALERFPFAFPSLYCATVRASEKTGNLSEAIGRFVAYQSQLNLLRKKLISASIYPLLLITVGLLVILFLMGYVVPKFSHIYEDIGHNLPVMSQLLMHWGRLVENNGPMMIIGFAGFVALLAYVFLRLNIGQWFGRMLRKIPAVGMRMRIYHLARFYRTLGMLMRGGIPVVTALDMVAGLLDSELRARLTLARSRIQEGQAISRAMELNGLTTPVAMRMLRVGERTGKMGEMMERIAAFYDEEMARWVEWFGKLFEPLLMVFIGLVIGVVVLLMYIPIFELAGSL